MILSESHLNSFSVPVSLCKTDEPTETAAEKYNAMKEVIVQGLKNVIEKYQNEPWYSDAVSAFDEQFGDIVKSKDIHTLTV